MFYKSIDLYINKNTSKELFIKKSRPSIYRIFLNLEDEKLKNYKYKHHKIEFHLNYDKGSIYFTRYINFKSGRTIFSCMKEMIKFLEGWKVDGIGHFLIRVGN